MLQHLDNACFQSPEATRWASQAYQLLGFTLCRDDVVAMYIEAIRNPNWQGVYNATAPNPVRMGELCSALGQV